MILGMVGWRGMVGSVLMGRMLEEGDFRHVEKTVFFSTSQAGQPAPEVAGAEPVRRHHFLPGRRLHKERSPEIAL